VAQLPVHVADGHEVAGAGKGEHLAPEAQVLRHEDGLVDFGQAGRGAVERHGFSGRGACGRCVHHERGRLRAGVAAS